MLLLQRTSAATSPGAGVEKSPVTPAPGPCGISASSGVFHVHTPSFTCTHIEMRIVLKVHYELKLMLHTVVIKENKSLITLSDLAVTSKFWLTDPFGGCWHAVWQKSEPSHLESPAAPMQEHQGWDQWLFERECSGTLGHKQPNKLINKHAKHVSTPGTDTSHTYTPVINTHTWYTPGICSYITHIPRHTNTLAKTHTYVLTSQVYSNSLLAT